MKLRSTHRLQHKILLKLLYLFAASTHFHTEILFKARKTAIAKSRVLTSQELHCPTTVGKSHSVLRWFQYYLRYPLFILLYQTLKFISPIKPKMDCGMFQAGGWFRRTGVPDGLACHVRPHRDEISPRRGGVHILLLNYRVCRTMVRAISIHDKGNTRTGATFPTCTIRIGIGHPFYRSLSTVLLLLANREIPRRNDLCDMLRVPHHVEKTDIRSHRLFLPASFGDGNMSQRRIPLLV